MDETRMPLLMKPLLGAESDLASASVGLASVAVSLAAGNTGGAGGAAGLLKIFCEPAFQASGL